MSSTMAAPMPLVTRTASRSVHTRHAAPYVHDADRRRDAIATRLTLRLSGVSDKQMARASECNRSTPNRWRTGAVDTPTTHFRRHLRKFIAAGAFPIALLADTAAEVWTNTIARMPLDELRQRKRDLHYAETAAQQRVDLWQMADLEGLSPECDDAVAESVPEQATRLLELYALLCEIRLRTAEVAR